MMRKKHKLLVMFFVVILFTTACHTEKISQTQQKIVRFSVKRFDLPNGWSYSGENWYRDFGGENYTVAYAVSDTPKIAFGHTISAYETEDDARDAYPKWENDVFSEAWEPWDGADFSPSDPNDLSRFECFQLSTNSPIIDCDYLQLHGRFISLVLVNLDSKSMTFEQLNEILGILDKRLNEVSIDD